MSKGKLEKDVTVEQDASKAVYLDTSYSFKERAADLVSRLTLEEKQSQLGNNMAAIPKLGVKAYNVWVEALHGLFTIFTQTSGTSYPNSGALGASWDPDLVERESTAISDEVRGANSVGLTGLTCWSPVVEPARDPRWGRSGECYGEDPFLITKIAGGFIRGMMGKDTKYLKTVPTAKHFLANNVEYNRHSGNSVMDQRDMREYYAAPYRTLIQKEKLPSVMTSYNAVNGIPTSANKEFLTTLMRKTWGLDGYIPGDCDSIRDIYLNHKYTGEYTESSKRVATALALKAGVDIDCGRIYNENAIDAINKGYITEADIDRALVNIFAIRMRTGEFDPAEMVPYSNLTADIVGGPKYNDISEEVAEKTPVLLKNSVLVSSGKKALPLDASTLKNIAIIGPKGNVVDLGPYSGSPVQSYKITPYQGITNLLAERKSSAEVVYNVGSDTVLDTNLFEIETFILEDSLGNSTSYPAKDFTDGTDSIKLLPKSLAQTTFICSINDGDWTSYHNVDITDIQKITFNLIAPGNGGIIEVRLDDQETGSMVARIAVGPSKMNWITQDITVDFNNMGIKGIHTLYFRYTAPECKSISQEAIEMARNAEVALVFVGTDDRTSGEEADRFKLILPGNQTELIKEVAAVNPNTIVIMQTLNMVEVESFKDLANLPGIIWYGFNGQTQGKAIAKILFGDVTPGGKLHTTWYKSIDDLPRFEDYEIKGIHDNGRTYQYFKKDVSYEFGYGLSYTTFAYSNVNISSTNITPNDNIILSVDVKNTGGITGDEVVQIYVRTPDSAAELKRPIKRLKGFKRVSIAAGETKTVSIHINCEDLWFWDETNNKITFDQGQYVFEIGASSQDIRGQVTAIMKGEYKAYLKTVTAECGLVIMESGKTVETNVTAAMSDDSFYDIDIAAVTYESNRPSVASVNAKGIVTTISSGVATITANVTIDEKLLSGSYPIRVH